MISGRLARRMAARMSLEKAAKAATSGGVGGGATADGGGEVLVAEVKDGVTDLFGLLGDAGADVGAAEGDFAAAGVKRFVRVAVQIEAEELAVLGVAAEDGADGVVGADLLQTDADAADVVAVELGAVADLGEIGFGVREDFEEFLF